MNKKQSGSAWLTKHKVVTILRILYPLWAIVGMFSIMYVTSTVFVAGDATKTAGNIIDNELLFRLGIAGSLITQLIHVIVVLLLYKLFNSVSKSHSMLIVILGLLGVPIAMLNVLNQLGVLVLLSGEDFLNVFSADQLHALVMFLLQLNEEGIQIASIFWGLWLFPLGYVVYKSNFFPKLIGYFLAIGGIGYLFGSFTYFLFPDAEGVLSVFEFATFGELLYMLWFLIRGARLPQE